MVSFGFYFLLFGHRCVARVESSIHEEAVKRVGGLYPEATGVQLLGSGTGERVQKEIDLALSKRSGVECPQQKKKSLEEAEAPQSQPSSPDPPKLQKVPVKNLWIPRL